MPASVSGVLMRVLEEGMLTAGLEQIATPDANHDEMLLGSLTALAGSANCRSVVRRMCACPCRVCVCHTWGRTRLCRAPSLGAGC
jgi:hypothetical protein